MDRAPPNIIEPGGGARERVSSRATSGPHERSRIDVERIDLDDHFARRSVGPDRRDERTLVSSWWAFAVVVGAAAARWRSGGNAPMTRTRAWLGAVHGDCADAIAATVGALALEQMPDVAHGVVALLALPSGLGLARIEIELGERDRTRHRIRLSRPARRGSRIRWR